MKPVSVLAPAMFFSASLFAGGGWELRGFFGPAGAPDISLRDPSDGRSRWVSTGEFDGDVYVESADAVTGVAVIHADGERFVLRLASESPASERADGEPEATDAGAGERPAPAEASMRLGDAVSDGLRRLAAEHPEYFAPNRDAATRRAFLEARREIILRAAESVRAGMDE